MYRYKASHVEILLKQNKIKKRYCSTCNTFTVLRFIPVFFRAQPSCEFVEHTSSEEMLRF